MDATNFPKNFYPTPVSLIEKMYHKIKDFSYIINILEPSAGSGDIVYFLANKKVYNNYRKYDFAIDCIEIDPILQNCIKSKFGDQAIRTCKLELEKLNGIDRNIITHEEEQRKNNLQNVLQVISGNIHLVADDFLSYYGFKQYDLIMMNPPFENGDKHLLKAISMMEQGGQIVCLLNSETIKNPYSNTRKELVLKLKDLDADIEYLQNEFLSRETERKSSVEVALIYINIDKPKTILSNSSIFENLRESKQKESERIEKEQGITLHKNYIELAVDNYNLEVEATIKLVKEYESFKKHIPMSFSGSDKSKSILKLVVDEYNINKHEVNINEYLEIVRMKYWKQLFQNKEFTKCLTSNLTKEFTRNIEKMKYYDFSIFNIKTIQTELLQNMIAGVEETILTLFDNLSHVHSFEEMSKNIHYYNGWKTNKAYRVNSKVIIPYTSHISSSYRFIDGNRISYNLFSGHGIEKLRDMEKAFNYLDNGLTPDLDIDEQLKNAATECITSKINLKYFNVTFYKKGTCHIQFTNKDLLEKFNLYGSQRKNWLPPSYGKKTYSEMDVEEKQVVSQFQGEDKYNEVIKRKEYFLCDNFNIPMLS